MARQRRWGKAGTDGQTPEERQQLERDTQLAIYRFQSDAYRNLRHSVAAAVIIFGLFVGSDVFLGDTGGSSLWARLLLLLSVVLGVGYFAMTNPRPRLGLQLLLAAVVIAVLGICLLILARYGVGS